MRYADDIVVGFQDESDARRFWMDLRQRMAQFGLELHPDKTRLLRFGRFAAQLRSRRGEGKPETFDFLGMTHMCGKTRAGRFMLLRHTTKARMRKKLQEVRDELMRRRHLPVPEQGAWLSSVVNGYFAYHAVPTNVFALASFRTQVTRSWYRALRRRSQRSSLTWARMNALAQRWVPPARIRHPWPEARFDARTRGRSPVR